jgi:predicted AlkP superfamily phosphohydrolase/phosphomutase
VDVGLHLATFFTGQNPANHGLYNYLVWNPDKMLTEPPSYERFPLRPFWRSFKEAGGPHAIVIDIPLTYATEPFNGKEIISLATHDSLVPMTGYPPEFVDSIRARVGEQIMSNERYGLQTRREFRATRDEVIRIVKTVGELCLELIQKEEWDFFLTSFASIHRAGHRLWALHNIDEPLTSGEGAEFSDFLHQVYISCDHVIGALVRAAGPNTTVLVFSPQGMRDNISRNIILTEMLQRVLNDRSSSGIVPIPGLLSRLRDLIPLEWRHRVKSALPVGIRHRLTAFWRFRSTNWSKTRAFSMLADAQGWIRINLKGREARGIVQAGREYDELCEKIARGLKTYVDADTNEPLVRKLVRTSQVFEGEKVEFLPDLMIQWNTRPACEHRMITSPRYGSIPWPTPGQNPEGRSGNHFTDGMLIAAGEGIKSGTISGAHILDLAPTILTLLGQPVPPQMEGRPLFKS